MLLFHRHHIAVLIELILELSCLYFEINRGWNVPGMKSFIDLFCQNVYVFIDISAVLISCCVSQGLPGLEGTLGVKGFMGLGSQGTKGLPVSY